MSTTPAGIAAHIGRCAERSLFQALLTAAGGAVIVADGEGRVVFWGDGVAGLLDVASAEACGQSVAGFLPPYLLVDLASGTPAPSGMTPVIAVLPRGNILHEVEVTSAPLSDEEGTSIGTLYLLRKIASCAWEASRSTDAPADDQPCPNHQIGELHHRVRNNLAIVSALLDLELSQAAPEARDHLQACIARIRTLALFHNLMFQGPTHEIEAGVLAHAVSDSVTALYGCRRTRIDVTCPTPIQCCPRRATYLGLLFTELAIHFNKCFLRAPHCAYPRITLATDGRQMTITTAGGACSDGCRCQLNPLSRDVLDGLVRHSLGGTLDIVEDGPFCVTVRCAVGEPATSRRG